MDCLLDSSNSNSSSPLSSPPGVNCIEHQVSKMDTLAGIAIKYGVEVSDIRRLNGLATDLQMFAHKALQIPLPGRHPPSPILSNGSTPPGPRSIINQPSQSLPHPHKDVLETMMQSLKLKSPHKVSPAMINLQGYYGLRTTTNNRSIAEGTEMTVYKINSSHFSEEKETTTSSATPPTPQERLQVFLNGFSSESEKVSPDNSSERSNGRYSLESSTRSHELILKDENPRILLGRTGKNLALRLKASGRIASGETDSSRPSSIPMADSMKYDPFMMRKSSSTSNLQDSEISSKRTRIPDCQVIPTSAITRPIFDGLPLPISGRRNKAALD